MRDLRIDWRWGAEWFERTLTDYTPDANWGNWGYRILPVKQLLPLCNKHLTSLEILSWPWVHDPHLEYVCASRTILPGQFDTAQTHHASAI